MTNAVPDLEEFRKRCDIGNLVPVYREILADRLTPVSAFEILTANMDENGMDPRAFLLESVEGGERIGRYSYIGINPSIILRTKGNVATLTENGGETKIEILNGEDPLTILQNLFSRYRFVESPGLPRFCGGAVGFFGYDVVRFFEQLPDSTPDELMVDDACFLFTDTIVIFDHVRHRILALCNAHITSDPDAAYSEALLKIEYLISCLKYGGVPTAINAVSSKRAIKMEHSFPKPDYEAAVSRCREYILAGDAFQIVLSQRFKIEFTVPPFHLYRALRSINPSPYMYYIDMGNRKLIGSSPEILVTVRGEDVCVRPIAGTRQRGETEKEDIALETELLADEKECAEHIMLVDLGRNDIGRVCKYGSVRVDELMAIERYSHVMHIVSNVVGKLADEKNMFDVLRACFPAGTVSGAPKVRAMEIIDELEPTRRGFYAGSLGYFSFSGDMDMAIVIRTMLTEGNTAYLQAGGGIVADSDPVKERQECHNKAKALVTAIQLAENGLD